MEWLKGLFGVSETNPFLKSEILDVLNDVVINYDVSADDQAFLMVRPSAKVSEQVSYLGHILVQNFDEELKLLVPN